MNLFGLKDIWRNSGTIDDIIEEDVTEEAIESMAPPSLSTNSPGDLKGLSRTFYPPVLPEGVSNEFSVTARVSYDYRTTGSIIIPAISKTLYNIKKSTIPELKVKNSEGPLHVELQRGSNPVIVDDIIWAATNNNPDVQYDEFTYVIGIKNVGDGFPIAETGRIKGTIKVMGIGAELEECFNTAASDNSIDVSDLDVAKIRTDGTLPIPCKIRIDRDKWPSTASGSITFIVDLNYGYFVEKTASVNVMGTSLAVDVTGGGGAGGGGGGGGGTPKLPTLKLPYNGATVSIRPVLNWSKTVSSSGWYYLEYRKHGAFTWEKISHIDSNYYAFPTTNSLSYNTKYDWRVGACNSELTCHDPTSTTYWSFVTDAECSESSTIDLEISPNPFTPTTTKNKVNLIVTASPGCLGEIIRIENDTAIVGWCSADVYGMCVKALTAKLPSGQKYRAYIDLVNNGGHDSGEPVSEWVQLFINTGPGPSAPVLISPGDGSLADSLKPALSWSGDIDSDGWYNIYYDTEDYYADAGTLRYKKSSLTSSEYTFTANLAKATEYDWQVEACNPGPICTKSTIWLFITPSA